MKLKYIFLIVIFLLVGCSSNSKLNTINAEKSKNFNYSLNLKIRDDFNNIKSNGEFLLFKIMIDGKNDNKYEDIIIEPILTKEMKDLFVDGIGESFKTKGVLSIDENYNSTGLTYVFSLKSLDDVEKVKKIISENGLEVLVTWKDGREKVLIEN